MCVCVYVCACVREREQERAYTLVTFFLAVTNHSPKAAEGRQSLLGSQFVGYSPSRREGRGVRSLRSRVILHQQSRRSVMLVFSSLPIFI